MAEIPVSRITRSRPYQIFCMVCLVIFAPLWGPYVVLFLIFRAIYSILIRLAVALFWFPRGKFILFVYSDSPHWRDYIEQQIFPLIERHSMILNWSQRKSSKWKRSLAVIAFNYFATYRDFNPMAIVFRPFPRVRIFRFHSAFLDFKHGHPLQALQQEFLEYALRRRKGH